MTDCNLTTNTPLNQGEDPCNGQYKSTKCVREENPLTELGVAANSTQQEVNQAIQNAIFSLQPSTNQAKVLTVKRTLTSEEVITLNSSPITLISAQGIGTIISIHKVIMKLNYGTTPFNFPSGSGVLEFTQGFSTPIIDFINTNTSILKTYYPSSSTLVENTNFNINAATGDATLGDSTVNIYITYEIITL